LNHFEFGARLIGLFAALSCAGCGGSSSGSGTCSSVTGCGGDLTGTWTISSACAEPEDLTQPEACGNVAAHLSLLDATGTITFNADGTESQSIVVVALESLTFPTSCLPSATQCDAATATVAAQPDTTDASCSFSTAGCTCSGEVTASTSASGTYQISGTSVIVTAAGESPDTDPYCVSGNELTLQSTDGNGDTTTITATR
jgi:hypothetical protein